MSRDKAPPLNDGGPAFPVSYVYGPDGTPGYAEGQSLRDHFAGQAMAAIVGAHVAAHAADPGYVWTMKITALEAYSLADAMIEARER